MDPLLQKFSPFIIATISLLVSSSHPKVFYIGLPAIAACFYLYYPSTLILQIVLLVIWGAHLFGTYKIAGFSSAGIERTKTRLIVFIAISIFAGTGFALWVISKGFWLSTAWFSVILLSIISAGLFYMLILIPVLTHVIAPLVVKQKTEISTTLLNYYKAASGQARAKVIHSYICFKNDPVEYKLSVLQFGRYRNKVDIPFSYIKCECLFGFSYVYNVKQLSEAQGRASRWEESPTTKLENKIKKYVAIFALVVIALFVIVLAAAGLLW